MRGKSLEMLLFLFWFLSVFQSRPRIVFLCSDHKLAATTFTTSVPLTSQAPGWFADAQKTNAHTNTHTQCIYPAHLRIITLLFFLGGVGILLHWSTSSGNTGSLLVGWSFTDVEVVKSRGWSALILSLWKSQTQMEIHGITLPGQCWAYVPKKYD